MRRPIEKIMDSWFAFWVLVALVIAWFFWLMQPAHATPLTFSFTGTTGAGDVSGSFTYETNQGPLATDVRGLLGNATYQMSSWNMTATSIYASLPTTNFSTANSSLEFCQGKCIFGSGSQWHTSLRFVNGASILQLSFLLADPTPLTSAPQAHEWGAFAVTDSRFMLTTVPKALATSGTLRTGSVPLPDTLWLFLGSFALLLGYRAMTPLGGAGGVVSGTVVSS